MAVLGHSIRGELVGVIEFPRDLPEDVIDRDSLQSVLPIIIFVLGKASLRENFPAQSDKDLQQLLVQITSNWGK